VIFLVRNTGKNKAVPAKLVWVKVLGLFAVLSFAAVFAAYAYDGYVDYGPVAGCDYGGYYDTNAPVYMGYDYYHLLEEVGHSLDCNVNIGGYINVDYAPVMINNNVDDSGPSEGSYFGVAPQNLVFVSTWAELEFEVGNAGGTATTIALQNDIYLSVPWVQITIPSAADITLAGGFRIVWDGGTMHPFLVDGSLALGDAALVARVGAWQALRDTVNASVGNTAVTVELTGDITLPNAAGDYFAITIPAGAEITLTSYFERRIVRRATGMPAPSGISALVPLLANLLHWRHFIVEGTLTLEDIILCGAASAASSLRGGVEVHEGGSLYMEADSVIRNNRFMYNNRGSGVSVSGYGSSFVMNGGEIYNNYARAHQHRTGTDVHAQAGIGAGGGVSISGAGASFIMNGGVIRDNVAHGLDYPITAPAASNATINRGGGVAVSLGASFTMYDGEIRSNRTTNAGVAMNQGGGVSVSGSGSVFTMHYVLITGNTTVGRYAAGGVSAGSGAVFVMYNGNIVWNLIVPDSDEEDELFVGAIGSSAGGVSVQGGNSKFYMFDGTISHNTGHFGGGVIIGRDFNTFAGFADNIANIPFLPRMFMYGGIIEGNRGAFGGGVNVEHGVLYLREGAAEDGTPTYGIIRNNTATGRSGGGLPTAAPAAVRGGGGVFLQNSGIFHMYAGLICGNRSYNNGGGVMLIHTNNWFFMRGGTIRSNFAHRIQNLNLWNNATADDGHPSRGGGVYVMAGHFTMTDDPAAPHIARARIIENNHAMEGGGVFLGTGVPAGATSAAAADVVFTMDGDSRITGNGNIQRTNRATDAPEAPDVIDTRLSRGHGVHMSSGLFNMHDGVIDANIRTMDPTGPSIGGGVFMAGGNPPGTAAGRPQQRPPLPPRPPRPAVPTFNMSGGTISNNAVTQSAAGAGGRGAGVHMSHNALFNMSGDTHIVGNQAVFGGGVYATAGTHAANILVPVFNMISGTIGGDADELRNTAAQDGGGVHLSGAVFNMTNGTISNNIAEYGNGGGVAMTRFGDTVSVFNMRDGAITGNTAARYGGGVFVTTIGTTNLTATTFTMHAGVIGGNTAYNGGGVALVRGSATADGAAGPVIFTMGAVHTDGTVTYGIISGNTAHNNGGGVWGTNTTSNNIHNVYFNLYAGTVGGSLGCPAACEDCFPNSCNPSLGNRAYRGGGVWAGDSARFYLHSAAEKHITGNAASYGGGVWVGRSYGVTDSVMVMQPCSVGSVQITHNRALRLGGGIYTQRYEYRLNLRRVPGGPPLGIGQALAYSNLTLLDAAFYGNSAYFLYVPPNNAEAAMPAGAFNGTSQTVLPLSAPTRSPIRVHPINNYDINFRVDTIPFRFFKAFHDGAGTLLRYNLLPDARFMIYRGDVYSWPAGGSGLLSIEPDDSPNPSPPWMAIGPGDPDIVVNNISNAWPSTVPLEFHIIPGFYYQLVEVQPPTGFQRPFGQWRLWVEEVDGEYVIRTGSIGGASIPVFEVDDGIYVDDGDGNYDYVNLFLPNWPDFSLPLTGGLGGGMGTYNIIGLAVIGLAGFAAWMFALWGSMYGRQRRRDKSSI